MDVDSVLAGKYRLVSLIGRGGMGSVWKAEHLALRAPVAIKLIDQSLVAMPEALSRFHREAQSAASLRSPHVVQILDHGIDEQHQVPFIVMELMEGESLATRLERVPRLSAAETSRIVSHVARALMRAHEAGIVHRDLKPDNVFLVHNEDEEIAKVLDFGIAKSKAHALGDDNATRTGSVLGTPYYMSPEQISGSKNIDYRTDLWALAVMAYEMLTGARPYNADTVGGLAIEICTTRPPPPSTHAPVPAGFDAWFSRATSTDVSQRFANARELADDLKRVCGSTSLRLSGMGDGTQTVARGASGGSLDALSQTTPPAGWDVRPGKKWVKLALAGAAVAIVGLITVSWLTSASEANENPVTAAARAAASAAAVEPANTVPPVETVAIPPAQLPAEVPAAAQEPKHVDLFIDPPRNERRTRPDNDPPPPRVRGAKPSKSTSGPTKSSTAAPSKGADSLPEMGSVLDDRK